MEYLVVFIEGIIAFISPCLLPMLPIYILYFAGQKVEDSNNKWGAIKNSIGFVIGFSIVFVILGVFASSLGKVLNDNIKYVNICFGIIFILYGLNFMDIIKLPFINNTKTINSNKKNLQFLSSVIFGIVFSISWTPCVGIFLTSALMLAASSAEQIKGIIMLLLFSIGLGIPFIISTILIEKLKKTFNFIKNNYKIINILSGVFLIIVGIITIYKQLINM